MGIQQNAPDNFNSHWKPTLTLALRKCYLNIISQEKRVPQLTHTVPHMWGKSWLIQCHRCWVRVGPGKLYQFSVSKEQKDKTGNTQEMNEDEVLAVEVKGKIRAPSHAFMCIEHMELAHIIYRTIGAQWVIWSLLRRQSSLFQYKYTLVGSTMALDQFFFFQYRLSTY